QRFRIVAQPVQPVRPCPGGRETSTNTLRGPLLYIYYFLLLYRYRLDRLDRSAPWLCGCGGSGGPTCTTWPTWAGAKLFTRQVRSWVRGNPTYGSGGVGHRVGAPAPRWGLQPPEGGKGWACVVCYSFVAVGSWAAHRTAPGCCRAQRDRRLGRPVVWVVV